MLTPEWDWKTEWAGFDGLYNYVYRKSDNALLRKTPAWKHMIDQLMNGNTIEQAKADKEQLENKIVQILNTFEEKYGLNVVKDIHINRYNGSNNAFGKIVEITVDVKLI